jgi:hypothetical protein
MDPIYIIQSNLIPNNIAKLITSPMAFHSNLTALKTWSTINLYKIILYESFLCEYSFHFNFDAVENKTKFVLPHTVVSVIKNHRKQ